MANRLCPLCGASYVEWATVCAECGVALVDPDSTEDPRSLPEDDQLVYELATWSLDQRTEVAQVMAESGIPHAWDDDELIVHVRFESAVDRLLQPIEFPDGAPAAAGTLPGPEGTLTEYDLSEWATGARTMVAEQLTAAEIPFSWDGALLLVSVDDEEAVDDLLDELEDSGALDTVDGGADDDTEEATDDGGAETPGRVLEMLFLAADRLRKDSLDADGLRDLSDAMDLADPRHPPYGVEMGLWRQVMHLADQLTAVETGEATEGDESISTESELPVDDDGLDTAQQIADDLRDLLRPYV